MLVDPLAVHLKLHFVVGGNFQEGEGNACALIEPVLAFPMLGRLS